MRIAVLSFSFLLTSCVSSPFTSNANYLQKLEKISFGSSKQEVLAVMGPPATEEREGDGYRFTYSIEQNGLALPRAIIWFDSQFRVVSRYLKFFDDDKMSIKQIEDHFSSTNFVVQNAQGAKDGHTFPSRKYLKDHERGIVVEINTARNNEATSIQWNRPEKLSITSGE